VRSLVFNNPFLGKAISLSCEHRKTPLSPAVMLSLACDDFSLAECGSMAIQPSGKLGTLTERDAVYTTQWDEKAEAECQAGLAWNEGLQHSLQHAAAAQALIHHGAQPDVQAGLLSETPLLLAAAVGNAALAVLLLEAGADPDFERWACGCCVPCQQVWLLHCSTAGWETATLHRAMRYLERSSPFLYRPGQHCMDHVRVGLLGGLLVSWQDMLRYHSGNGRFEIRS
jgi:hypothetical protein